MSVLSLILPTLNQPDLTEDPKINNALTAVQTWANGNIDTGNMTTATTSWAGYAVAWTASPTNPVVGNGTLTGAAWTFGKQVWININLVIGSTTTLGSGSWLFSLPAAVGGLAPLQVITGYGTPNGLLTSFTASIGSLSATTIAPWVTTSGAAVNSGSPAGWAAGNQLVFQGVYQRA